MTSKEENMLEKLALIVAKHADTFQSEDVDPSFDTRPFDYSPREWATAQQCARAVIEALMEPTPEIENIWKRIDQVRFDYGIFHSEHRAMLQSILQSNEEGEGR